MMKTKKIDWLTTLISFAASAAVFGVCLAVLYNNRSLGIVFNVIGTAVTVTLPVIISALVLRLFPKRSGGIKISFPKFFTASCAILLLILFLIAGIGELLYSLSVKTYEVQTGEREEREVVEYSENADIILILDRSGSLEEINKKVEAACKSFLDGISSECNMGGGSFANENNFIAIQKMDQAGKENLIQAIECKNDDIGTQTELHKALETALNDFKKSAPEKHKAIVLFSDGFLANLDTDPKARDGVTGEKPYQRYQKVYSDIVDQGIELYTIRPDEDFYKNNYIYSPNGNKKNWWCSEALLECVKKSGGVDFSVIPSNENSSEEEQKAAIEKILNILNDISNRQEERISKKPVYETRHEVVFRDVLMLYDTETHTIPGMIIAAVCLMLFAALIQAIHFSKASFSGFVFIAVLGLAAFGVTLAGGVLSAIILPAVCIPLLLYTLFIKTESR